MFLYSTFTRTISALLSKFQNILVDRHINIIAKIKRNLRRFSLEGISYPPSAGPFGGEMIFWKEFPTFDDFKAFPRVTSDQIAILSKVRVTDHWGRSLQLLIFSSA